MIHHTKVEIAISNKQLELEYKRFIRYYSLEPIILDNQGLLKM
jgi:hypothetical protein